MRAYSMDLRESAPRQRCRDEAADVAAKYRVSGSWVRLRGGASSSDRDGAACLSRTYTPWPR